MRRAASEICAISHILQRPHNLERHFHTEWISLEKLQGLLFRMVTRCQFPTVEADKGNTNVVVVSSDEDVSIAVKVYQT